MASATVTARSVRREQLLPRIVQSRFNYGDTVVVTMQPLEDGDTVSVMVRVKSVTPLSDIVCLIVSVQAAEGAGSQVAMTSTHGLEGSAKLTSLFPAMTWHPGPLEAKVGQPTGSVVETGVSSSSRMLPAKSTPEQGAFMLIGP